MQQFLIPSSGGASQIINIPVSLLSQGNQQPISFITANGQIFQLPNFSQLVVHQNGENGGTASASGTTTGTATAIAASASTTSSSAASSSATSSSSTPSTGANQQQQQQQQQALILNSQGQIISLPVLQPQNNQPAHGGAVATTATVAGFNASNAANNNQQQQAVNLSQINFATLTSNGVQLPAANIVTAVNRASAATKEEDKSDIDNDDNGPTIASMPTNVVSGNALTTQVTHHATTVDGVNLDEIREFAKAFKLRRLALGLTQTQVGQALSATKGPAYSQSAICRFEKLDITPKSAAKIKPVLEKWMQEAELKYADRLKTGSQQNFADLLGSDSTKKRKRRTSFTPQALEILNEAFEKNTHPSDINGNQGADMTMLANKLNYDREVIRVWFCNKRQALKNTIKKFKQGNNGSLDQSGMDGSMSPGSPNTSLNSQANLQTAGNSANTQQASSVAQSLVSVATSSASASPSTKTVITLNCTNQTNPTTNTASSTATPASTTTSSSPSSSSQNSVANTTTLKIENVGSTSNGDQEQQHIS